MNLDRTQIYVLVVGAGLWTVAIFSWFFYVLQHSPSVFNTLVLAVFVLLGAMWLERFLHTRAIQFETEEARARGARKHRVHMIFLSVGLAATIGVFIIMLICFRDDLFEIGSRGLLR